MVLKKKKILSRSHFNKYVFFSLSPFPDDIGDSLDASSMDLLSLDYRVNGDVFELRIGSATVINPSTAFIEIWGESGGADFPWYRWVLQSGVASIQGYQSGLGFQSIGNLTATFTDDHHVVLSWNISDMGLGINSLSFGVASGWCGPPAYFCDHYPNGWGYPYVGFDSGSWFSANF